MIQERKSQDGMGANGDSQPQEGAENRVEGSGDVFGKIVQSVAGGITRTANGFGKAGVSSVDAIAAVVQGAVRAAVEGRTDLAWGAKAIVLGVMRGTGDKEDAGLETLSCTARAVIRQTAGMGADIVSSVKGLVLGAIASAKSVAVSRDRAASAAAQGALAGAEEAGSVAAEKVRDALRLPIGGLKGLLLESLKE